MRISDWSSDVCSSDLRVACDSGECRRGPGIEGPLALPQADQQCEEDGGEGEVEAVACRVLQHAAEDGAERRGGDPAQVERQRQAEVVGRRQRAPGAAPESEGPALVGTD